MDLSTWVDPDAHGWIVQPTSEDDWTALLAEYGGKLLLPLARVIEVVRLSCCRSVVIENRYTSPITFSGKRCRSHVIVSLWRNRRHVR